jgi:succinate-acetate transporter protein
MANTPNSASTAQVEPPAAAPVKAEPAPAAAEAAPVGDPQILGLPIFAAGSVSLGLALVGYVPVPAQGSALPIIFAATGIGLFVSTIWAASLHQTMVACVFGLFTGFWWSYAALALGLRHDWFVIPAKNVDKSVALFLITWGVVMFVLMLATVRLPVVYTAVVALVVVALVLLTIGTLNTDDTLNKAAGYVSFVFAALGLYAFLSAASVATGGRPYPLGRPLVK